MITLDEARAELVALVEEAADLVGGEWTVEAFEGEGWCNYAEGVDGKNFAVWRSTPGTGDPKAVAAKVQADWEAKGLDVTTRLTPDPDLYEVIVRAPGGFHANFSSSAAAMILSGESECIRAD